MQPTARTTALLGGLMAAWALAAPPARAGDGDAAGDARVSAGTYLAARAADGAGDLSAASTLFAEALAQAPADPRLLEGAMAVEMRLGRLDAARDLADRMAGAGLDSPLAHLVLAVAQARDGDWTALAGAVADGRGVGTLADGLVSGWARMGEGDTEAGLAAFDALAATQGLEGFGLYHKALALAVSGDLAGAEAVLALPESEGMQRTRRAVLAHAEVLGALGRGAEGVALLDATFGPEMDDAARALRDRLSGPVTWTFVATPREGMAEAWLNLAAALAPEDEGNALVYARAALLLDPAESETALLAGGLLADLGQLDLAREAYAAVPPGDPAFLAAEMGRAALLREAGEDAAALEVLTRLSQDAPDRAVVLTALGDLLRATDRPGDAESAYGRAIAATVADAGGLWVLHFNRALARHAQDDWPGAEADLRRALEIRPDQPQVLNHLGYTLVDRGERLDEALGLIEKAVALRPDSGAIVDSLGWAYFRLGRHAEAVAELEKAAALEATDAVVNDHLGDAYWMVGREREARFQWTRALNLGPTEADAERIRLKLVQGLDLPEPAAVPVASSGSTGG